MILSVEKQNILNKFPISLAAGRQRSVDEFNILRSHFPCAQTEGTELSYLYGPTE